jgi:hypothetical protein
MFLVLVKRLKTQKLLLPLRIYNLAKLAKIPVRTLSKQSLLIYFKLSFQDGVDESNLNTFLTQIVRNSLSTLESCYCIEYDDDGRGNSFGLFSS